MAVLLVCPGPGGPMGGMRVEGARGEWGRGGAGHRNGQQAACHGTVRAEAGSVEAGSGDPARPRRAGDGRTEQEAPWVNGAVGTDGPRARVGDELARPQAGPV